MKFLLLSSVILLSSVSASNADWRSERTTVGPNGVTSQATTSVARDGNTRVTQTEVLRSNGTGYMRNVVQTWDPETQSWSRSVIGKTANGGTWTTNGSRCGASIGCSDLIVTG